MGGVPSGCAAGGLGNPTAEVRTPDLVPVRVRTHRIRDAGVDSEIGRKKKGPSCGVQGGPKWLVGPGGGGHEPAQAAGHLRRSCGHAAVLALRSSSQDERRGSARKSGRWLLTAARHRAGVWPLMRLNTVEK